MIGRITTLTTVAVATASALVIRHATASAGTRTEDPGAGGCPVVAGIFLPGTWETTPNADPARPVGMLAPIATSLQSEFGSGFVARFPGYSASAFDRGLSYGDSKATGVAAATREITTIARRCPATKFILAGYSQGADAMGDLATAIGCGQDPITADRVIAVGLIADPKQGTAGGKLVGPPVDGQGIAGVRRSGFCALSAVTAEICNPRDLYCSTNTAANPILAGLGRILTQPTTGHTAMPAGPHPPTTPNLAPSAPPGGDRTRAARSASTAAATRSMISDFTGANLGQLASDVHSVVSQTSSGDPDPATLSGTGSTLTRTLQPLADLSEWAARNPATATTLAHAPTGSAQNQAGQVLAAMRHSDLPAALNSLSTISHGGGSTSTPTDRARLAGAGNTLASATAPLTGTPADVLNQAQGVLAVLKPVSLVDQVVNVATNGLEFATNVPHILDTVAAIAGVLTNPGTDLAAKVRGLHDQFATLNTSFAPVVKMAAGVDLHMVSSLIGLIPDPSGTAAIASVIVGVLANLDVVGLALQVGRLQEQLWSIAEALTAGDNLADIATKFLALAPTLAGFAAIAVNTLIGAAKTAPQALDNPTPISGPQDPPSPGASGAGGAGDLAGLAQSFAQHAAADGATDLSKLTQAGITALSFFASGTHTGYDHYVVDSDGRTAITWITEWFARRIRAVEGA